MDLWSCFICGSPMKKESEDKKSSRTKHHLKPRAETDTTEPNCIYVHQSCHGRIHKFFSNKELLEKYHDPEVLKEEFRRRQKLHSQGKFKNFNYRENL